LIDVHLCCNDERGNFSGALLKAEFFDGEGEMCLELDSGAFFEDDEELFTHFEWEEGFLRFETPAQVRRFAIRGRGSMTGNVFWESTQMEDAEALDFAEYLVRREFDVLENVCEPRWERFRKLQRQLKSGLKALIPEAP